MDEVGTSPVSSGDGEGAIPSCPPHRFRIPEVQTGLTMGHCVRCGELKDFPQTLQTSVYMLAKDNEGRIYARRTY